MTHGEPDGRTAPGGRDVVVVGSGRSGSSLVAGLVAGAGHDMGRRMLRTNDANPRGFFEDLRTILVNEQLLETYTAQPPPPRFTGTPAHQEPLRELQRWLAVLPPDATPTASPQLVEKMRATIRRSPWCRKDPRFCLTLPAWEPVFGDALRICVFREPSRTANSMVALARLQRVELSFEGALEIWASAYERVLRHHRHRGEWIFVHYEQVLDGTALPVLDEALGVPLDRGFVDTALRRASPAGGWPAAVDEIYQELCDAAHTAPTPSTR